MAGVKINGENKYSEADKWMIKSKCLVLLYVIDAVLLIYVGLAARKNENEWECIEFNNQGSIIGVKKQNN